jgi:hypothetical protein
MSIKAVVLPSHPTMLSSRNFIILYPNFLTDISRAGYFLTKYYDHLRSGYDQIAFPYGNIEIFCLTTTVYPS